mmetsp:Transcript_89040/g.157720  ORF Transcript_89040/g.157720 Transcript_89040/m.157720 type:complete len:777 (-) Transcript_89040:86-2416(-)|eukprot:CAMPEP_0197621128 /NCGR_PEP_ID=MMETSP1338-20131121/1751_1 /TAXON_ID=43686 ORGANISM="Pelagodinium beii, Strain RCC1491" /NCGR_SAMPLE_ID=MMETSP1338 /ASSEMBLY_ACC=CAM_ASM_000754 /LENGTH=776 /DNA_ID=CAMNT_0043190477 /DNA_START=123 /DNA_END=2453 /DNA_ORIENTATION=+
MLRHLCLLSLALVAPADGVKAENAALLQTSVTALESVRGADAVKPVITMLQAMEETLSDEAREEDERKTSLVCWCKSNRADKKDTIDSASAKVVELRSVIDTAIAKQVELLAAVKDTSKSAADGDKALQEAEQVRRDQKQKYDQFMLDSRKELKALQDGIRILERFDRSALPQVQEVSSIVGLTSLLQLDSESSASEDSNDILARKLDDFMRHHGYDTGAVQDTKSSMPEVRRSSKFLEPRVQARDSEDSESDIGLLMQRVGEASLEESTTTTTSVVRTQYLRPEMQSLSSEEQASVNSGLAVAAAFVQSSGGDSSELFGNGLGQLASVLKATRESLEDDVKKAQEQEKANAENFLAMKLAKMQETGEAEAMLDVKKTELSRVTFTLTTSKKSIKQESELLGNTKEALQTLEETCEQGLKNIEERQEKRAEESKGVSEALATLGELEAAENEKPTSFLQLSEASSRGERAAAALRSAAASAESSEASQLEVLASSAEVQAFDDVIEAIGKNVDQLKSKQRSDDKKRAWCREAVLANTKEIEKATHRQSTLEVGETRMKEDIESFTEDLAKSKEEKKKLEAAFIKATDDLKKQHDAYMRTATDNAMTLKAIATAKEKLKAVYRTDTQALVQTGVDPIAPGSDATYNKNRMGNRVIVLLGYLQQEAQEMIDKGSKAETQSQEAYGKLAAQTKKNVIALQKEINTREAALVKSKEDLVETQKNMKGLIAEQADLASKMKILRSECDDLTKNFDDIKKARYQEMQAMMEAKAMLEGVASR